jgi:hypothetical protein
VAAETLQDINTANGYTATCRLGPTTNVRQVTFSGSGNAFVAELYIYPNGDPNTNPVLEGVERTYPAGSSDGFTNCAGAQFRSASPGLPAVINGAMAYGLESPISLGPQLGPTVNVLPVGDLISGYISADGTPQGVGFTVAWGGAGSGQYSISPDVPFTNWICPWGVPVNPDGYFVIVADDGRTVVIVWKNFAGTPQDTNFFFGATGS